MASPGPDHHNRSIKSNTATASPTRVMSMSTSPALMVVDNSGQADALNSAPNLSHLQRYDSCLRTPVTRRKKIMMPANEKDTAYWIRRRKNNEAAKRSREKRRLRSQMLVGCLLAMSEENAQLKDQMFNLQYKSRIAHAVFSGVDGGHSASLLSSSAMNTLPVQAQGPALLRQGLWGGSSAPALGSGHRASASSATCIGNVPSLPLCSGPQTEYKRSAGVEMASPWQVYWSRDIFPSVSPAALSPSYPAIPTSKPLQHSGSAHLHPDQGWCWPCQSPLARCRLNNWPLQYQCAFPNAGLYPNMPSQTRDAEMQSTSLAVLAERAHNPASGSNNVKINANEQFPMNI